MLIRNTFRFEKSDDDALEKIRIKENITKTKAINNILKLGLESYFNKPNESENDEKKMSSRFDAVEEKIKALSVQIKDVDLKSFRMNLFITDFAKAFFEDDEKFNHLNDGMVGKLEKYKIQIKYIPKLGFVVLKYMKSILNKNIPTQFYSEIDDIYSAMSNKK